MDLNTKCQMGFLFLIIISLQMTEITAEAKLSIKFISYDNPNEFKYDSRCCDGEYRFNKCTGGCDHRVRVCIDPINSATAQCDLGTYELGGVAFNEASFDFPQFFLGGLPNPFPISLPSWQKGVQVVISMFDGDTDSVELMDRFQVNFTQGFPRADWTPSTSDFEDELVLEGQRPVYPSRLVVAFEAYCDTNFYGENCSMNCVPENDCLGHYECNRTTGDRICMEGWTGQSCNLKVPGVSDCLPGQNCNAGTCVAQGGNSSLFYCCCDAGYEGDNCEIDVDECSSNPCQNGGVCFQDKPNSYQCTCPLLYTGSNCERQRTCEDDPCGLSGICIPLGGSNFQCACSGGTTGEFCEISSTTSTLEVKTDNPTTINIFSSSVGDISTTMPNAELFCPPNYYGPSCSVYCKADETCGSGYFFCDPLTGQRVCSEGWLLPDCITPDPSYVPEAECPESNCRNGGFCKNSTCCCSMGYTGRLCHIEILECDSNPCINDGKCKDEIGDYRCECQAGFDGRNCEVVLSPVTTENPIPDPCQSLTCDNGGTCVNDEKMGALCLCPRGFSEESCRNATSTITNTVCPPNKYGLACDVTCIPMDSCTEGHYDCHYSTGQKICLAGWTGTDCLDRFLAPNTDPECPENACRNGGQCSNGSCCCLLGFQGQFCQEEIFECSKRPCLNNGRCVELATGFDCVCPNGFTGDLCEIIQSVSSKTSTKIATTQGITSSPGAVTSPVPFPTDFVGTIYLMNWWKFLDEAEVLNVLRYAIYITNVQLGINESSIQVSRLDKQDALDPQGRSIAKLTYNASLVPGYRGPLRPPSTQFLQFAARNYRSGLRIYDGPTPWGYDYHYDLYYKAANSESLDSVISRLNQAWMDKYTEYKDCACSFVIQSPRQIRYVDRNGAIITRYIYFVLVDGRLNNPAVQPGPSITDLSQYFIGTDGEIAIVSERNLTQYEDHHEIYLTGNLTDKDKSDYEEILKDALLNSTTAFDNCGMTEVVVVRRELLVDENKVPVTKFMYSVRCDQEAIDELENETAIWDRVDDQLERQGDGDQKVFRNTTLLVYLDDNTYPNITTAMSIAVTPPSTMSPTTVSSTSYQDFTGKLYLLTWWRFLEESQVEEVLKYAIYLSNVRAGISVDRIQISFLEKHDALDQQGRNVAELVYMANVSSSIRYQLQPPSLRSLLNAIIVYGYGLKIYNGLTPWRYIYHYDLYYKTEEPESLESVISKLNQAWMDKYPDYKDCKCTFDIQVPRRVRYLDISGAIITRYIYFVLVDRLLNNPAVQPGPTITDLCPYFIGTDGEIAIVSETNLTQYEDHHEIYLTGNLTAKDKGDYEEILKDALLNSTNAYKNCSTVELTIIRREVLMNENRGPVTKFMYSVRCDQEAVNELENETAIWDRVDDQLERQGDGDQKVFRNTTLLVYPDDNISPNITTAMSTAVTTITSPSSTVSTTTISSTSSKDFTGRLYLLTWWRFLDEADVMNVLKYAVYLSNIGSGLFLDSIQITYLEKYDALDQQGRNVAELVYNASISSSTMNSLQPPSQTSLIDAIRAYRYNLKVYNGPTPWRYMYHYDLYYKTGDSETLDSVISKLKQAWLDKYPVYEDCDCDFVIRVPRRVRYLDSNGAIITRYIYFVLVDDRLNNPAVQPGPTITDLSQYFIGTDGEIAIVSETNLTQYEDHHEIYLTGNLTDEDKGDYEEILKDALLNSSAEYSSCGQLMVHVARRELLMDTNNDPVTKFLYTVRCDEDLNDQLENETVLWDRVDDELNRRGGDDQQVVRNTTLLVYLTDPVDTTTTSSSVQVTFTSSTSIKTSPSTPKRTTVTTQRITLPTTTVNSNTDFDDTLFVYQWWDSLIYDRVIETLRYAVYLANVDTVQGITSRSINIKEFEKHNAMDASGQSIAELVYNASLLGGLQGALRRPTIQHLNTAIKTIGYTGLRVYNGPRPWRYIYHYDLYYKAEKAESSESVISKLKQAWLKKYPEYQTCECELDIFIPRVVPYLDLDGDLIFRYIYFVLVDDVPNDPTVKPGPTLDELMELFESSEGKIATVTETDLIRYDAYHEIYITGTITEDNMANYEEMLKKALLNSTPAYKTCGNVLVKVARIEPHIDTMGRDVSKLMYTVLCGPSQLSMEPICNDTILWNALDAELATQSQDDQQVYRDVDRLFELSNAYTLFVNGELRSDLETAIMETWKTASPDIRSCNCEVTLNIVRRQQYVGIYGIQMTGITYFITKEAKVLNPITAPAPDEASFQAAIRDAGVYNNVYLGEEARPYALHYSFLTKEKITKTRQSMTTTQISSAWQANIPADYQTCTECSLRVYLAKPEVFYSNSREMLYKIPYFLNWGSNVISPLQTASPSDGALTSNDLAPCGCQGLRRRHIDIYGHLSYAEEKLLQEKIRSIWIDRYPASVVEFVGRDIFMDSNSGDVVTRIYFTVILSQKDASAMIFTLPALEGLKPKLSPFLSVVTPTEKVYIFYLFGDPTTQTEQLTETIEKTWLQLNNEVLSDDLTVTVLNQDGYFIQGDNDSPVTEVRYTVTILGADSSITNVEEPPSDVYEATFSGSEFKWCACNPRKIEEVYISGPLADVSDETLEDIIAKAWKKENPDFSGTLTTNISSRTNGFQSSEDAGTKLTRIIYTVNPDDDRPAIKSTELSSPENAGLNSELQVIYPDLATYDGDVIKEKVESSPNWIIPVVVVICLLLLVIIIVVVVLVIRKRRNRQSRTLKRNPNEIRGFDKEHFSTEPDFDNPAFDASELDETQKHII